jgi:hypothetical protein
LCLGTISKADDTEANSQHEQQEPHSSLRVLARPRLANACPHVLVPARSRRPESCPEQQSKLRIMPIHDLMMRKKLMARLLFTDVSTCIHRGYSALCRELKSSRPPPAEDLGAFLSFRTYAAEQPRFFVFGSTRICAT